MVSFSDQIPKRCRTEKYYSGCKKHGGAHTTHNITDGQKYDSNGTLKKSFKGKTPTGTSHGPKRPTQGGSSFVQLSAKINKIEKSNKKMKCTLFKQKKHKHHKDSNDSDSS